LPKYDESEWDILPTPLSSSVLVFAAYNDLHGILELGFVSGAVYRYYGVTPRTAKRLIERAPSKGRFFNRNIKREYAWAKVRGRTTSRRRR